MRSRAGGCSAAKPYRAQTRGEHAANTAYFSGVAHRLWPYGDEDEQFEFCLYFLLLRDARIHCLVNDKLTFSSMHIFVNNT